MAHIRTTKEVPSNKPGYKVWNVNLRGRGHELVMASANYSEAISQIKKEFGETSVLDIRETVSVIDLSF